MISQARDAGPVVVLDAGQSLAPATPIPAEELAQRRAKADLIASAFESSGMDVMTLGSHDWALGVPEVRALVTTHHLPVIAANLTCDGTAPYPAYKVVERAGRRLGFVGVTDGVVDGCVVGPLRAGVVSAIEAMGVVDVVVVLLPTETPDTLKALVGLDGLDLVIDADPTRRPDLTEPLGSAWTVGAGKRGQIVGGTVLTWVDGGQGWAPDDGVKRAQDEVARLQRRVDSLQRRLTLPNGMPDPKVAKLLDDAKRSVEQAAARVPTDASAAHNRLGRANHLLDTSVADEPTLAKAVDAFKATHTAAPAPEPVTGHLAPESSAYAGSDTCRACHPDEFAQWVGTPHATAWASLLKDHRERDQECVSCHATGVGLPGGLLAASDIAGLRDVQCESCHGPSKEHAAVPPSQRPPSPKDATMCLTCHDGKRDEGRFDFKAYLPKVVHRPRQDSK